MNAAREQLHGWKEIACHLKRSVRCVQRWERHERLPVRRHDHAHGVSVYAFSHELEAWWRNEQHKFQETLEQGPKWDHCGKENNKSFSAEWRGENPVRGYRRM